MKKLTWINHIDAISENISANIYADWYVDNVYTCTYQQWSMHIAYNYVKFYVTYAI